MQWPPTIYRDHLNTPEPFGALNKISLRENGEPLVDLREVCPVLKFKEGCVPYVREQVAVKLNVAAQLLPVGHVFQISTALRTIEMQGELYWTNFDKLKLERPELPLSALRRRTNKYFAPPDYPAPPGHTTGAAIDLTILNPDGEALLMTDPYEEGEGKAWEVAATFSEKISLLAQQNRLLLIETLFTVGFSNCRDEWWHWSYGDNAWAVRMGKESAFYGLIPPPVGYTVC
jgi:zinc D-Ala-D-Ala dipeptidase